MVMRSLEKEGSEHYKGYKIEPAEFIARNNLGFVEGNIIKYVLRHKNKDGLKDLQKAKHYLEMLIELEEEEEEKRNYDNSFLNSKFSPLPSGA